MKKLNNDYIEQLVIEQIEDASEHVTINNEQKDVLMKNLDELVGKFDSFLDSFITANIKGCLNTLSDIFHTTLIEHTPVDSRNDQYIKDTLKYCKDVISDASKHGELNDLEATNYFKNRLTEVYNHIYREENKYHVNLSDYSKNIMAKIDVMMKEIAYKTLSHESIVKTIDEMISDQELVAIDEPKSQVEEMDTPEKLANDLDKFMLVFDHYGYQDAKDEYTIENLIRDIVNKNTLAISAYLTSVLEEEEDVDTITLVKSLIGRLDAMWQRETMDDVLTAFVDEFKETKVEQISTGSLFKLFYTGQQDNEAIAYQKANDYKRVWVPESQGTNGDVWAVYKDVSALPTYLQEYVQKVEESGQNINVDGTKTTGNIYIAPKDSNYKYTLDEKDDEFEKDDEEYDQEWVQ